MMTRPHRGLTSSAGMFVLAALLALAACGAGSDGPESAVTDGHSPTAAEAPIAEVPPLPLGELADSTDAARAGATAAGRPDMRQPGALVTVSGVPVVGRTGPGDAGFEVVRRTPEVPGSLTRRIGTATFDLALRLRRPELTQYPCTSCHLGREMAMDVDRIADAHQDIRPVHPAETGATCATCHASTDVERLTLFDGETVGIDHTYRLCAQCHFQQLEEWAGGAHGKRLDGWQGRRVVMGCADCHDPHDPAVEARLPYPGPNILRPGLREP